MMLCFHAWCHNASSWGHLEGREVLLEQQVAQDLVRLRMDMMKNMVQRTNGNGWKVQKFHELLYLVCDMDKYGLPTNFIASDSDCHHKINRKEVDLYFWTNL